jgi:1-acyl-sn-glycerol-3-phosphate acyltransferase
MGYWITKFVLTPYLRLFFRIRVEGRENIPERGPAILASNHISFCDSFFLPLVVPRRVRYVAKAEYFENWKVAWFFRANGHIPIRRGEGSDWKRAMDGAAEALDAGELFGIYPEGTRSKDGRLHRGHTGPARLALRTRTPIIPVGIVGTREVQPPDAKVPKPFKRVSVRFGRPVEVTRYQDRADDRMVLRSIIDEVMFEIRELSGQEYVDEYATKKAEDSTSAHVGHVASLAEVATA